MACQLRAIIGEAGVLRQGFSDLPAVSLAHDLALIPIETDAANPVGQFYGLTEPWRERLVAASLSGPIAYIEAEFFGGRGTQSAIAWKDRVVTFGPVHTQTDDGEEEGYTTSNELAINQVLRVFGIESERGRDEFDTVGLGRFRESRDWTR